MGLGGCRSSRFRYKALVDPVLQKGQRAQTVIMFANYAMGRKTEALAYFDSLKVAGRGKGPGRRAYSRFEKCR